MSFQTFFPELYKCVCAEYQIRFFEIKNGLSLYILFYTLCFLLIMIIFLCQSIPFHINTHRSTHAYLNSKHYLKWFHYVYLAGHVPFFYHKLCFSIYSGKYTVNEPVLDFCRIDSWELNSQDIVKFSCTELQEVNIPKSNA